MTLHNDAVGGLNTYLPSDLRLLTGEGALLTLTLDTVTDAEWKNRTRGFRGQTRLAAPMILTLISYSYSSGIYASQDIEAAAEKDSTFRYICARKHPEWQEIRRFRRSHREIIQRTLVTILTRVCSYYVFPQHPDLAARLSPEEVADETRTIAMSRIEAAIIMDGVEADI